MKNILITGGAGFIGSRIALKLHNMGYQVTVLDNLSPQIHGKNPDKSSPLYADIKNIVHFIKGSVTERPDLENALRGQDAIIHLAAETGTGQSMYEIERYVNTNIGGTALLLDMLINTKHSVKKVVVAESRAVYGEGKYHCARCGDVYPLTRTVNDMEANDFGCKCPKCGSEITLVPTTEDSAIHPTSIYGLTKDVQGKMVHMVCSSLGIDSVSFRYQNVYGPGQSLTNPYTGILSIFSTLIREGKSINIFEDGKESRDFVYIDDVADATILGLEANNVSGRVFNIGSGEATDVLTVAQTLCDTYKIRVPINISGNFRIGDIRHNIADITSAKKLLGYSPKWNFKAGISKFCEWVLNQPVVDNGFENSLKEMRNKGLMR